MKKLMLICCLSLVVSSVMANEVKVVVSLTPAGSFEATTPNIKGALKASGNEMSSDELSIRVDDLKTGIDLRDDHLHKHLNSKVNPLIIVKNIKVKDDKGEAVIVINKVEKPITFKVKKGTATFTLVPTEFGLKEAEYMGIGVVDEVEVTVTMAPTAAPVAPAAPAASAKK